MFSKDERSSFKYWFAHWCAFNMTALNLKAWKFKYLFHDWYKPWLRLFMPYEKVQRFHRTHSKHHLEWLELNPINKRALKFDWASMLIDWECSRFTKEASPLDAYGEYLKQIEEYRMEALRYSKEHNACGHNWNAWMVNKLTIYGQLYLNRLGLIKKESE